MRSARAIRCGFFSGGQSRCVAVMSLFARLRPRAAGPLTYADTRFYATDSQGITSPSTRTQFQLLGSTPLPPRDTRATPPSVMGSSVIRSYDKLYCIGKRRSSDGGKNPR